MSANYASCCRDRHPRGRPPVAEPATIIITMRVSPTEWVDLRQLATVNQQPLSAFIRCAINQAALDCRDDPVFRERRREPRA